MSSAVRTKEDTIATLKHYSAFILLGVMLLLNLFITPNFFRVGTLWNIVTQTCTIILTGMGMTAVISTGGIDISVGAVMALAGIISAKLLDSVGLVPAILIAVLFCCVSGVIAGFMVGRLKVQAMVVTLALLIGVRGVAQLVNDAKIFYLTGDRAEVYKKLGTAKIGGVIPIQVILIIAAVAVTWFILEKTMLGRHIQAVGDNSRSAMLAGISATKTLMFVYIYSAAFAAFAGIVATAKIGAADGNSLGLLAELDAIAAVAVGGTSMSGGRAKVFGTVVGALIMQLINITVNMNNITYEYAQVFKAIIIVFAVYIQRDKAA
ncbi:MAG: ABC transporter permease [Lachnospiraceae bacterium]|nr:ABC transporter permease [Lachnospiraceae bacterium]MDD2957790.1 ABC transporter permease [Lachnospiraceae bacterium]